MRVTNTTVFRNFNSSISDVHSKLNKSMNKVSSGKAYEAAADNPLNYYLSKKIDGQFQEVLSNMALVKDVKHRLNQQESGALSIQKTLSKAKQQVEYILSDTNNGDSNKINTIKDDLLQKAHSMVNDLNGKYQNYYIYGGSDATTAPFSLSADGLTLTFKHKNDTINMTLEDQGNGTYAYNITDDDLDKIRSAMEEQGRMDLGYGSITDKNTLMDTYTGGLNLLTGLSSDAMKASTPGPPPTGVTDDMLRERLNNSPIALIGRAVAVMDDYTSGTTPPTTKEELSSNLKTVMDTMTKTEHNVSTVYSDLGNKYALLETMDEKLSYMKLSLTEQYKDKWGADPYESIMDWKNFQYSYDAALQAGSNLIQGSLFDFIR